MFNVVANRLDDAESSLSVHKRSSDTRTPAPLGIVLKGLNSSPNRLKNICIIPMPCQLQK